jgi:NAD(P)-dependent dehydrogenase (short-subunit alcohol dehydrogenase family)
MTLEGKIVLVVGAGRGIGRRATELFSEAGANVVLSARTESELLELEYRLNTLGNQNVLTAAADASIPEQALGREREAGTRAMVWR